jgi:DNA adenine methylase
VRTPITYYGGKQRLAGEIISMIPPHKLYCEPFLGGGAVFFNKAASKIEVLNDHNDSIVNFYLCVQNRFDELQLFVQNTLHSESMYYHAKDVWAGRVEATDVEKAWAVWMVTNGSFAGSMNGGWKWCNGTSGGHTGRYMAGKRNDFSEKLRKRLQDVQISCRDALRVIEERDTPETFFYLDPPYPGVWQGHYKGYSFHDLCDLLELLATIKGKFVLSNYWSQTLRYHILKHGWNHRKIEIDLRLTNLGSGGKGIQKRTEILVYNYDLEPTLFDSQQR